MQINRKYILWIMMFVVVSLIIVLFIGTAGINILGSLSIIVIIFFYVLPIAIAVYVICLAKRCVDCKVAESKRVVEMDAKIELLKQQIEQVEGKGDKIAEIVGSSSD